MNENNSKTRERILPPPIITLNYGKENEEAAMNNNSSKNKKDAVETEQEQQSTKKRPRCHSHAPHNRPLAPSLDVYLQQSDDYSPRPEWCLPPVLLRPNNECDNNHHKRYASSSHPHYGSSPQQLSRQQSSAAAAASGASNTTTATTQDEKYHQWNHYPYYHGSQQQQQQQQQQPQQFNDGGNHNIGEGITFEREYNTALHIAIRNDATKAALELIRCRASVNFPNLKGVTPIILASQRGNYQVVKELLHYNANPCASSLNTGTTALIQASHFGKYNVVQLLLQHGANVEQANYKRTTALMRACQEGHYDIAKLLLQKYKGNVNRTNHEKMSALLLASHRGHANIVQLLIQNGADMDTKTAQESTSLMLACKRQYYDVVKVLVENGCDVTLKDSRGRTAYDTAAKRKLAHFCFLLEQQIYFMKWHARKERNFFIIKLFNLYQQSRAKAIVNIRTGTNNTTKKEEMTIQEVFCHLNTDDNNYATTANQNDIGYLLRAFTLLPVPLMELIINYMPLPHLWEKRLSMLTNRCHVDPDSTVTSTLDLMDDILSQSGFEEACDLANLDPPPYISTNILSSSTQPSYYPFQLQFQTWSDWKAWGNQCDSELVQKFCNHDLTQINESSEYAQVTTTIDLRRKTQFFQILRSAPRLSMILSSPPYNMPGTIIQRLQANHDIQSLVRRIGTGTNGVHFEVHVAVELVMLASQLLLWHHSMNKND